MEKAGLKISRGRVRVCVVESVNTVQPGACASTLPHSLAVSWIFCQLFLTWIKLVPYKTYLSLFKQQLLPRSRHTVVVIMISKWNSMFFCVGWEHESILLYETVCCNIPVINFMLQIFSKALSKASFNASGVYGSFFFNFEYWI